MNTVVKNNLLVSWGFLFSALALIVLFANKLVQPSFFMVSLSVLFLLFVLYKLAKLNFNHKASKNKQQSKTAGHSEKTQALSANRLAQDSFMHTLREIDRAILSNASFERVVNAVLSESQKIIPSSFVSFAYYGNRLEARSIIEYQNGTKQEYVAKQDKVIEELVARFPEGGLIDCRIEKRIASKFPTENITQLLINPIYKDGELVALLTFGFGKDRQLSKFELSCAKDLADRLGVAKTVSVSGKVLKQVEYYDGVTQLLNRQSCYTRLNEEISRVRRLQKKLSVLYIDLNNFKKTNDTWGHDAGDLALKEVAHRLKTELREIDLIARIGADEFVVVVSDIEKPININVVAAKLIESLQAPFLIESEQIDISCRIGISIFPDDGISAEELIQHANMAMIKLNKSMQQSYTFYEPNMSVNAQLHSNMQKDLELALEENEFILAYQPQVSTRSGKVVGVEALVRWRHPERGSISPLEFIPLCEETGLIIKLGKYVHKMACLQYIDWLEKGIKPPKISLNVSISEIQNESFAKDFIDLLNQMQVPSSGFELEITESMLMESEGKVIENLKFLNEHGVTVALDDFGTGYSNLSYLVRLPFNVLKVDRSFVKNLGKFPGSTEIVTMIIDMAHHLGKIVVAEGIENEMQRDFLLDSSCDLLQGYLISKPLQPDDLEVYLSKSKVAAAVAIAQ